MLPAIFRVQEIVFNLVLKMDMSHPLSVWKGVCWIDWSFHWDQGFWTPQSHVTVPTGEVGPSRMQYWLSSLQLNNTNFLIKNSRCRDQLVWEAVEIELQHVINQEYRFSLNRSQKPLIHCLKERKQMVFSKGRIFSSPRSRTPLPMMS